MQCPFCRSDAPDLSLVCAFCARDIAVPVALLAERDELSHKRDALEQQLLSAKAALETIRKRRTRPL